VTRDLHSLKEKNGEHPLGDAGQLIGLAVFVTVWIADSFFLQKTTFLTGFFPLYQRITVLVLCVGLALYLFRSGHVVVSGDTRSEKVVATGAFRYVRHPLYLGSLLLYFGFSFATGSLASFAMLVVMILFYDYIASYEEKLMVAKTGDDYTAYMNKTNKWLPKLPRSRDGRRD
jgi:protein-S-isoprenylcysteine O-methyltransferase Ste14